MDRKTLESMDESLVFADGFDDAILGLARRINTQVVAYDYDKAVEILVERDLMTWSEAVEYLEFNTVGAWVGEQTPIWIERS